MIDNNSPWHSAQVATTETRLMLAIRELNKHFCKQDYTTASHNVTFLIDTSSEHMSIKNMQIKQHTCQTQTHVNWKLSESALQFNIKWLFDWHVNSSPLWSKFQILKPLYCFWIPMSITSGTLSGVEIVPISCQSIQHATIASKVPYNKTDDIFPSVLLCLSAYLCFYHFRQGIVENDMSNTTLFEVTYQ